MKPRVIAICKSERHAFSKSPTRQITLVAGHGIDGDSHAGTTVQHRSRVARDPSQPNLRQVHLMHAELFDELAALGFAVGPGDLGENITTEGVDLLALGEGTLLHIGAQAVVRVTGLRNPCKQIDAFQKGLMAATLAHDAHGNVVRKAGVMAVVETSGSIVAGDTIIIEPPSGPWRPLVCV